MAAAETAGCSFTPKINRKPKGQKVAQNGSKDLKNNHKPAAELGIP